MFLRSILARFVSSQAPKSKASVNLRRRPLPVTRRLEIETLESRQVLSSAGMLQYATLVTAGPTSTATTYDQFASKVVSFSSQYGSYGWSANQTLGRPDVLSYGDASQAWSPWYQNGTSEQLT